MRSLVTAAILLTFTILAAGTASANIVISEFDLANEKLELINTGAGSIDMSSWWLCNRVNGSPFYATITGSTSIDAANSTAASYNVGAGELLTLNVSSAMFPDANGELGLYNSNSFGSASAIEDYILWGANGIRDFVAQTAGIWIDNDSISVAGIGAGETIQLTPGQPGDEASHYTIAASTIGTSNGTVSTEASSWSKVKSLFE